MVSVEGLVFLTRCLDVGIRIDIAKLMLSKEIQLREDIKRADREKKELLEKKKNKKRKKDPLSGSRWKELRDKVIGIYGRDCMKCGSATEGCDTNIDHIMPKSIYPELIYEISNLQVLCRECNFRKGYLDFTDYRPDHAKFED